MSRTVIRTIPFLLFCASVLHASTSSASEGPAGPDQVLCGPSTFMAADPLLAGQTGLWSVSSGTAMFVDNTSPFTQVTGLSFGDNVLSWTIIGNGAPQTDQVIITVHDPAATVSFAGPDTLICLAANTIALQAADPAYPAIGSWTSAGGVVELGSFTDPHSEATFGFTGTYTLSWTVFNGPCGQATDEAIVVVEECVIGIGPITVEADAGMRYDPLSRQLVPLAVRSGAAVQVFDRQGRLIFTAPAGAGPQQGIACGNLPTGVYFARLIPPTGYAGLRFVVGP